MAAKLMKFAEGQKQMLNSLRQNFSLEAEGSFTNFETFLEGLATRDTDNKKLVLDQVRHSIVHSPLSVVINRIFRFSGSFSRDIC